MVCKEQIQRISGASLDFLFVSAVTTIQLKVVMNNLSQLLILVVSGTIFCVAYGTTKKAFVKEAIALLKKSNVKLLGTVMTMVDAKQSRSYINGRYTNYYYNGK